MAGALDRYARRRLWARIGSGRDGLPHTRPTRGDIFGSVKVDYKLFTNVLGVAVFAALIGLTMRRGATDPSCGMKVDRAKAIRMEFAGETYYFCSERCLHAFELDPERGLGPSGPHAAHVR